MKILALGGAGQEGARAVNDLAASPQVEAVVIGDINLDAANRLKESIGSAKLSCVQVDATNHDQLVAVLKDVDVVLTFRALVLRPACLINQNFGEFLQ